MCSLERTGSVGDPIIDDLHLLTNQPVDPRFQLLEAVGRFIHGAADDQRCACLVDQHRVDLVDDGVMELAVDDLVGVDGHVVAQVIETELVVGTVGNVRGVNSPPLVRRHVVGKERNFTAEESQHPAHPLRVTAGEVIVDRDQVGSFARDRVEIERHDRHECLAFSGGHFGDPTLVQNHRPDQLNIVRDHVPDLLMPPHRPGGLALGKAAARLPDHAVRFGQYIVEALVAVVTLPELVALGPQLIVAQRGVVATDLFDLLDQRL